MASYEKGGGNYGKGVEGELRMITFQSKGRFQLRLMAMTI